VSQSITEGNYLVVKVHNSSIKALIDTGSGQSLISKNLSNKLKLKIQPLTANDSTCLFAAEGSKLRVAGYCEVILNVSGLLLPQRLLVISNLGENLLFGTDFLRTNQVILNFQNGFAVIHDNLLTVPLLNTNRKQFLVKVKRNTFLPAFSESLVPVKCDQKFDMCDVLLSSLPSEQFKQFAVARSVNHVRDQQTVCRIMNYQPTPMLLQRGKVIALIEQVDCSTLKRFKTIDKPETVNLINQKASEENNFDENNSSISTEILEKFEQEYQLKISKTLETEKRLKLLKLLFTYKDVFARSMSEIKGYKH